MTTIAFTGTRHVPDEVLPAMRFIIKGLKADVYVSGAALGVDTAAAWIAMEEHPTAQHHVIIPDGPHNDIFLGILRAFESPNIMLERMPAGTDYMDRNQKMVDLADKLIAFPATPDEKQRSGTWATIRRGRKKDIPVHIFALDELVPPFHPFDVEEVVS
jgi:hypothetical protein